MTRTKPDWTAQVVILVVGLAATAVSFSGLSGLAEIAGLNGSVRVPVLFTSSEVTVREAWLLPTAVDAYGYGATRVWLGMGRASKDTRTYARHSALAAIGLSISGNALYHGLTAIGLSRIAPLVMVLISVTVGAIAPFLLGFAAHLLVRLRDDMTHTTDRTSGRTSTGTTRTTAKRSKAYKAGKAAVQVRVQPSDHDDLEAIRTEYPDRVPNQSEIRRLLGCRASKADRLSILLNQQEEVTA